MLNSGLNRGVSWFLFGGGFLLAITGFMANAMWKVIPWGPAGLLVALGICSLLLAWGIGRFFHMATATAAAAVWLAALAYFVGIAPFGAVCLLVMAALSLGSLIVPAGWHARVPLSILSGLAIISGIDGWLLPYPMHGHAAYLLVLLLVSLLRWRELVALIRPLPRAWADMVSPAPGVATLAIVIVGMVSTCAWAPTIHFDDLAGHLRLPYQLSMLGYYRMDAGSQVWAVAAWAGDVLHGIAQLVAGREARGAVDMMWLVLALSCMWSLCESLLLSHRMRWLAIALFVTLPLTADTLASMQTEGATTAVVAGLALLIQRKPGTAARSMLAAALLFGLLLGLKVSNLMVAGSLGLWLLWEWRARLEWRALPLAILLLFCVAGSSYFYAYVLTGNPVLPLFNAYFHSPYYSFTNFHDTHWSAGLHWNTLWDITFHTRRYLESGDGSGGFILLALLGSLLVAIADKRARPLALAASLALVLPLTQIQYLRYAHPAMVMLVPAMLCGVPIAAMGDWRRAVAASLLLALLLADIAVIAQGSWQLRQGLLRKLLTEGRTAVLDAFVPTHRVTEFIKTRYGDEGRTLLLDGRYPFVADLAGNAFVTAWYDPEISGLAAKAKAASDSSGWQALFQRTGVNLLVLHQSDHTPTLDAAIAENHGARVYEAGEWELWALHPGKPGAILPAPQDAVVIKFNRAAPYTANTSVEADVVLGCRPVGVPIVIAWDIVEQGTQEHWQHYEWANCLQTDEAEASLRINLSEKAISLTVTATPAKPVDMGLNLITSEASFSRDLAADRDVAKKWRAAPLKWLKKVNKERLERRKVQ